MGNQCTSSRAVDEDVFPKQKRPGKRPMLKDSRQSINSEPGIIEGNAEVVAKKKKQKKKKKRLLISSVASLQSVDSAQPDDEPDQPLRSMSVPVLLIDEQPPYPDVQDSEDRSVKRRKKRLSKQSTPSERNSSNKNGNNDRAESAKSMPVEWAIPYSETDKIETRSMDLSDLENRENIMEKPYKEEMKIASSEIGTAQTNFHGDELMLDTGVDGIATRKSQSLREYIEPNHTVDSGYKELSVNNDTSVTYVFEPDRVSMTKGPTLTFESAQSNGSLEEKERGLNNGFSVSKYESQTSTKNIEQKQEVIESTSNPMCESVSSFYDTPKSTLSQHVIFIKGESSKQNELNENNEPFYENVIFQSSEGENRHIEMVQNAKNDVVNEATLIDRISESNLPIKSNDSNINETIKESALLPHDDADTTQSEVYTTQKLTGEPVTSKSYVIAHTYKDSHRSNAVEFLSPFLADTTHDVASEDESDACQSYMSAMASVSREHSMVSPVRSSSSGHDTSTTTFYDADSMHTLSTTGSVEDLEMDPEPKSSVTEINTTELPCVEVTKVNEVKLPSVTLTYCPVELHSPVVTHYTIENDPSIVNRSITERGMDQTQQSTMIEIHTAVSPIEEVKNVQENRSDKVILTYPSIELPSGPSKDQNYTAESDPSFSNQYTTTSTIVIPQSKSEAQANKDFIADRKDNETLGDRLGKDASDFEVCNNIIIECKDTTSDETPHSGFLEIKMQDQLSAYAKQSGVDTRTFNSAHAVATKNFTGRDHTSDYAKSHSSVMHIQKDIYADAVLSSATVSLPNKLPYSDFVNNENTLPYRGGMEYTSDVHNEGHMVWKETKVERNITERNFAAASKGFMASERTNFDALKPTESLCFEKGSPEEGYKTATSENMTSKSEITDTMRPPVHRDAEDALSTHELDEMVKINEQVTTESKTPRKFKFLSSKKKDKSKSATSTKYKSKDSVEKYEKKQTSESVSPSYRGVEDLMVKVSEEDKRMNANTDLPFKGEVTQRTNSMEFIKKHNESGSDDQLSVNVEKKKEKTKSKLGSSKKKKDKKSKKQKQNEEANHDECQTHPDISVMPSLVTPVDRVSISDGTSIHSTPSQSDISVSSKTSGKERKWFKWRSGKRSKESNQGQSERTTESTHFNQVPVLDTNPDIDRPQNDQSGYHSNTAQMVKTELKMDYKDYINDSEHVYIEQPSPLFTETKNLTKNERTTETTELGPFPISVLDTNHDINRHEKDLLGYHSNTAQTVKTELRMDYKDNRENSEHVHLEQPLPFSAETNNVASPVVKSGIDRAVNSDVNTNFKSQLKTSDHTPEGRNNENNPKYVGNIDVNEIKKPSDPTELYIADFDNEHHATTFDRLIPTRKNVTSLPESNVNALGVCLPNIQANDTHQPLLTPEEQKQGFLSSDVSITNTSILTNLITVPEIDTNTPSVEEQIDVGKESTEVIHVGTTKKTESVNNIDNESNTVVNVGHLAIPTMNDTTKQHQGEMIEQELHISPKHLTEPQEQPTAPQDVSCNYSVNQTTEDVKIITFVDGYEASALPEKESTQNDGTVSEFVKTENYSVASHTGDKVDGVVDMPLSITQQLSHCNKTMSDSIKDPKFKQNAPCSVDIEFKDAFKESQILETEELSTTMKSSYPKLETKIQVQNNTYSQAYAELIPEQMNVSSYPQKETFEKKEMPTDLNTLQIGDSVNVNDKNIHRADCFQKLSYGEMNLADRSRENRHEESSVHEIPFRVINTTNGISPKGDIIQEISHEVLSFANTADKGHEKSSVQEVSYGVVKFADTVDENVRAESSVKKIYQGVVNFADATEIMEYKHGFEIDPSLTRRADSVVYESSVSIESGPFLESVQPRKMDFSSDTLISREQEQANVSGSYTLSAIPFIYGADSVVFHEEEKEDRFRDKMLKNKQGLLELDTSFENILELPDSLSKLNEIQSLRLDKNWIRCLPESIDGLNALEYMSCRDSNMLTLPDNITKCKWLKYLDLDNNMITRLPRSITELKELQCLSIQSNRISPWPRMINGLTKLQGLDLSGNTALVSIGRGSISRLTNLRWLFLERTSLIEIPPDINKCTELLHLSLASNMIRSLPSELSQLSKLHTLNLSGNRLSIFPEPVCHLNSLTELSLSKNDFRDIPDRISNLTKLKKLDLEKVGMKQIPLAITKLISLESLNIGNNKLSELPLDIVLLCQMRQLNMHSNMFEILPEWLFTLSEIEVLNLSNNRIKKIPQEIDRLTKLRELDISSNKITEIAGHLNDSQIEHFNISGNNFKNIPSQVTALRALKHFVASCNQITDIPRSFVALSSLEHLDLSKNNLETIGTPMDRLVSLKYLNLSSNKLIQLGKGFANGCSQLLELNLQHNYLRHLPLSVTRCPNLQILRIDNNKIPSIPTDIDRLENLQILTASQNRLITLPDEVCNLYELKTLNIRRNHVRELPLFIDRLRNIDPSEFKWIAGSSGLVVDNEQMIRPPPEVIQSGRDAVFRYFKELRFSKSVTTNRRKIVLLGQTGAGKSSFANALLTGASHLTAPEERTRVMEQHLWTPTDDVKCQINDFGGHDIYTITHHFFLTPDAIYLVVLDVSIYTLDNHYQLVQYWIDLVTAHVPHAVIRFVATHSDLCTGDHIQNVCAEILKRVHQHNGEMRKYLQSQISLIDLAERNTSNIQHPYVGMPSSVLKKRRDHFQNLLHVAPHLPNTVDVVSSAEGLEGIDLFVENLMIQSSNLSLFRERVLPSSWLSFEEAILSQRRSSQIYLTWKDLERIAEDDKDLDRQQITGVVTFLTEVGEVLWYKDQQQLQKILFHRPSKLAEIMKGIFKHDIKEYLNSHHEQFAKILGSAEDASILHRRMENGVFPTECFRSFWNDLDDTTFRVFFNLMQAFHLCYVHEYRSGGRIQSTVCFPCYLPEATPSEVLTLWPDKPREQLHLEARLYFFPHLPTSFIEEATVRLQSVCETEHIWRNGLYATSGYCKILLHKRTDKMISWAVRGDELHLVWSMFLIISKSMETHMSFWPGAVYEIYNICGHCVAAGYGKPHMFPGEILSYCESDEGVDLKCPRTDPKEEIDVLLMRPPENVVQQVQSIMATKVSYHRRKSIKLGVSFESLDELAKDDEILNDDVLQYLASQLGAEWKSVALLLDFSPSNIKRFEYTDPFNREYQIFNMFREWRDTWRHLRFDMEVVRQKLDALDKALIMVGRVDLADFSEGIDFDDFQGIIDSDDDVVF